MCDECEDAFRLAGSQHPSGETARNIRDDLDLWDAWSLLGDVGDRAGRPAMD